MRNDSPFRIPHSVLRIGLVLVLAAALRVLALDKPLYIDEIVTITVATQSLEDMPGVMRQIDATPGLFPVLLHAWMMLGRSDVWVRLLPALFGLGAVVMVYLLGRRLFDEPTALWAAVVAAIAPAHVHYAQYVRNYSIFTFLAGVHLLLFVRWFRVFSVTPVSEGPAQDERPGSVLRQAQGRPEQSRGTVRRRDFILFVLVTAALLYTHYLSLLLLVPEGLFALWQWPGDRVRVLQWIGATTLAGVLYLPGLPLLLHNIAFDRLRNEDRARPPSPEVLFPNLMGEMTVGQRSIGFSNPTVRRAVLGGAAVVFPALLVVGIAAGWKRNRDAVVLLLLFAFLPVLIYVGSGRRLVAVRFFLPFMLGYIVMLGHGLSALRWPLRTVMAALVTVLCAIPLFRFYREFDWSYDHRAVARAIAERDAPGDVLLVVHPYEAFYYRWYLGSALPMVGLTFTALEEQAGYIMKPADLRVDAAQQRVTEVARTHGRFWIVGQSLRSFASNADAERQLLAWIDGRFTRVADLSSLTKGDPVVRLYASSPVPGRE
jgi:4-amino-4-deoxy-L-arabinose transferase-like glycosyltransferase